MCVRLLAVQSLRDSGVPLDLPRYLEKLLRVVHQFPTTDLLYAIRSTIAKQKIRVLELVSEDVLVDFVKTCKLLTNENTSRWHEAAIISINISSAVCDDVVFQVIRSPKTADIGSLGALGAWAVKVLLLFDSVKAGRVLHSLVARVMFFTSRNQDIPMSTRVRILDLVCETLDRF